MIKIKKNKLIIISITIVTIIAMIALVLVMNSKKTNKIIEEESINIEKLTMEFDEMFNNSENEYVVNDLFLQDEKVGTFYIDVHIPKLTIESQEAANINKEIDEIFINKLMQVGNESTTYTILKLDYATQINNDILSLAIKCVLKEGSNPQRTIIKTYNYNLKEDKLLEINDLIEDKDKEKIQKNIQKKVETEIKREETIIKQGYSVYRRNEESSIYKLENASEFYIAKDKILYIIYCYGNSYYTTETDLIITKL